MSTTASASNFALVGKNVDGGALHLVEILGSGGFGVVYRAIATHTKEQYAVKVIPKKMRKSQRQVQLREMELHDRVSEHENIVTLHHAFTDSNHVYFVFDACLGGDLFSAISERATYFYQDRLTKKAFIQLIDAVEYCHLQGVYHRDLKPENILCSADGSRLYITDFGLATDNNLSSSFGVGSSLYMSPECIRQDIKLKYYSPHHCDIWALGLILINMTTGRCPWRMAVKTDECFRDFVNEPEFLRNILPLSKAANELVRRALAFNPLARITLKEFRDGILAADTLFMSKKELIRAGNNVWDTTMSYLELKLKSPPSDMPLPDVLDELTEVPFFDDSPICSSEQYTVRLVPSAPSPRLLPQLPLTPAPSLLCPPPPMLAAGGAMLDVSSTSSSAGPVTPQTQPVYDAETPVALESIDELVLPQADPLITKPCDAQAVVKKHKADPGTKKEKVPNMFRHAMQSLRIGH